MNKNPSVKKDDIVVLTRASNGQRNWEGIPLRVLTNNPNGNFTVARADGTIAATTTIYNTHPADEYILADRKIRLEFAKKLIKKLEKEISKLNEEIKLLEKFKTDDEELAFILDKLMKSKGIKAKVEVINMLRDKKLL